MFGLARQYYLLLKKTVYLRFLNKENIRLKFQYFPEHTSLNMGIKCRIKSISHLQIACVHMFLSSIMCEPNTMTLGCMEMEKLT